MGTFSADPMGNSGQYFDPTSGAAVGGPFGVGDFVSPLEVAMGSASGGGGSSFIDPLAGGFIDPTVASTAPSLPTIVSPIDPTLGVAIDTSPGGGAVFDTGAALSGIDPATGLPLPSTVFTTTTYQGPTVSDLQNLPLINQPTIPSYVPPIDTTGQVTSVSQLPTSVFDPSLLPTVSIPTTPYGGILPPVAPPAPPKPGLLSQLGSALKNALGGGGGGSAGGAGAGTPKPSTGTTQPPKLQQAGLLPGGGSLLPLLLLGAVVYLATRKD